MYGYLFPMLDPDLGPVVPDSIAARLLMKTSLLAGLPIADPVPVPDEAAQLRN